MKKMSLFEYEKTAWWTRRSREFRKGKTCARCGASRDLQVHHKRYRLYREREEDLEVLCKNCHLKKIHKQKDETDMEDFNHIGPTARLSLLIDTALESRPEVPRSYLGASRLGEECGRMLQYEFFGSPKDKTFPGKTLRTFAIGHALEDLAIEWITAAGVIVGGRQAGFSTANGLIRGHVDGVINGGPADFGPFPRLLEIKTASAKKWKEMERHHVQKANPIYYVQVQLYQAYLDLQKPALFMVINKDTSELYFEDIEYNPEVAQEISDKGVKIILACQAGEMLPRISDDPEFFKCKWCSYSIRCFNS